MKRLLTPLNLGLVTVFVVIVLYLVGLALTFPK